MTEALLELLPDSPVYHVGMYRNPGSNIPVQYYNRLPKGHPSDVALVLDPVIASCEARPQHRKGGAVLVKQHGYQLVRVYCRRKHLVPETLSKHSSQGVASSIPGACASYASNFSSGQN